MSPLISSAGLEGASHEIISVRERLEASAKKGQKDLILEDLRELRDLQVRYGAIDSALATSLRVVEMSGLSKDRHAMAKDWLVLSEVNRQAGDLPRAIEAGKRYLLIIRSTGDERLITDANLYVMDLLIAGKRYDEFRHQSDAVLTSCRERDDALGQARVLYRQAEVLAAQGRSADALSLLHAALRSQDQYPDAAEAGRIWFNLARVNAALSQWEAALSAYREGMGMAPDAPYRDPGLFGVMANIQEGLGNLEAALQQERLLIRTKDSLITAEKEARTADLQALYGVKARNKDMVELQEANREALSRLHQARTRLRWALIGAAALLVGLILMILIRFREASSVSAPIGPSAEEAPLPGTREVPASPVPAILAPPLCTAGDAHLFELLVDTLCHHASDMHQQVALNEVRSRIRIVGLLQRNIRKSELLGGLNLRAHFTSLANNLLSEYDLAGKAELDLDLAEVVIVAPKDLLPLSLLISELMRTSMEQALKAPGTFRMELGLRPLGTNQLELLYSDSLSSLDGYALGQGSTNGALTRTWASALGGTARLLKADTTSLQFTFHLDGNESLRKAS